MMHKEACAGRYKNMKIQTFTASTLMLIMASAGTWAKVSSEQALQLGSGLTMIGAESSANKSGSIPNYNGGLAQSESADPYADIYADEKPLFTITSKNLEQYKDNLSQGQLALFEKYADTYSMPIYQTHRTASYPDGIYAKAKKNATATELVSGGSGLTGFDESIPFAIPSNGVEVIWNHISRYRGGSVTRNSAKIAVKVSGGYVPVKIEGTLTSPQYLKGGIDNKKDDNILFYYMQAVKSPARLTGNVLLVHETIDQIKQPRMAWTYNAGQRRVRRAPQVAYDAPAQGTGGMSTSDQVDMYNGAPNKYDWKLIGKKEVYIPYNSYRIANQNVKYSDIAQKGHIDQSFARYELHRVWQVEATLKEGERHVYGKRMFYIDEDSWQIALSDQYDNRGILWRASEGHAMQFVNSNTSWYVANTNYDLLSGGYIVDLMNEEKTPFKFGVEIKRKNFTASALRRQGKR